MISNTIFVTIMYCRMVLPVVFFKFCSSSVLISFRQTKFQTLTTKNMYQVLHFAWKLNIHNIYAKTIIRRSQCYTVLYITNKKVKHLIKRLFIFPYKHTNFQNIISHEMRFEKPLSFYVFLKENSLGLPKINLRQTLLQCKSFQSNFLIK